MTTFSFSFTHPAISTATAGMTVAVRNANATTQIGRSNTFAVVSNNPNLPGAPQSLSLITAANQSLTVGFSAPSSGGALDSGSYQLQYKVHTASQWTAGPTIPYCTNGVGSFTDANNTVWDVRSGQIRTTTGGLTTVDQVTSSVTYLTMINGVFWQLTTNPANPGWYYASQPNGPWTGNIAVAPITSPGVQIGSPALATGTQYDVEVRAGNVAGFGPYCTPITASTLTPGAESFAITAIPQQFVGFPFTVSGGISNALSAPTMQYQDVTTGTGIVLTNGLNLSQAQVNNIASAIQTEQQIEVPAGEDFGAGLHPQNFLIGDIIITTGNGVQLTGNIGSLADGAGNTWTLVGGLVADGNPPNWWYGGLAMNSVLQWPGYNISLRLLNNGEVWVQEAKQGGWWSLTQWQANGHVGRPGLGASPGAGPNNVSSTGSTGAWMALPSPTITTSTFSFQHPPVSAAAPTMTVGVRDANATNITAISNTFVVTTGTPPADGFSVSGGKIFRPDGVEFKAQGWSCLNENINNMVQNAAIYPLLTNMLNGTPQANVPSAGLAPNINIVGLANQTGPADFTSYVNGADQAITWLTAKNIVVILSSYTNAYFNGQGSLTSTQLTTDVALWGSLAGRYKDNPYVWYLAGPNEGTGFNISTYHKSYYDAIRNAGATAPIGLCVPNGSSYSRGDTPYNNTDGHYNTMTGVFWSFHPYDWEMSGQGLDKTIVADCQTFIRNWVAGGTWQGSADGVIPTMAAEFGNAYGNNPLGITGDTCFRVVSSYSTTVCSGWIAWIWHWPGSIVDGYGDNVVYDETPPRLVANYGTPLVANMQSIYKAA